MSVSYSVQPLGVDPATLDGLSKKLITSHHANNYGGAVKRLNAIRAELAKLDWAKAPGFVVSGLKREELIAANSAFLHELYFDCLGAGSSLGAGSLSKAFTRDFGSFERWRAEFEAIGRSLRGGSGWALCSWSIRANRLVNHWSADHAHLMLAGLWIGFKLYGKLDEAAFRKVILAFLSMSGLALIVPASIFR